MSTSQQLWTRVKRAHADGRLLPAAASWLKTPGYLVRNPAARVVSLHAPQMVEPSADESVLVQRIRSAYRLMKRDQASASDEYRPSSLWQFQLDDAYAPLNAGDAEEGSPQFHFFLANFGNWDKFTGVTWSTLVRSSVRSTLRSRHLQNVFLQQMKLWKWFYGGRKAIASLEHPGFGNHVGAFVDGTFVALQSFPAEIYGSNLAEIVQGNARPVIAELGAGYGVLAHYLLRTLPRFCFIDFDLPETLCLAAYFLMKAYPEKRALLYGEEPYTPAVHDQYDLIFMPSFEMEKLGPTTVDLFLNGSSLGEMTREAAENYIHLIADASTYFFHMNHDHIPNVFSDGEHGLLGHEYPVPRDHFRLLYRYPDIFHMTNRGFLDFGSDTFMYLYERRHAATS